MKKVIALTDLFLVTVLLTSCSFLSDRKFETDNSPETESVRTVSPFTKIRLDAVCDVYFTQGDSLGVVVRGRRNTIEKLKTEVSNGELLLKWTETDFSGSILNRYADVYITAPTLESVAVHGSGDFKVMKRLDADALRVSLQGTGDIDMAGVVCESIDVSLAGTGDIGIKNLACKTSRVTLAGTGDIDINEIEVDNTELCLNGVGDIDMNFQNCGSASCRLNGVGGITLKGTLRHLTETSHGVGDIDKKDLKVGDFY